MALITAIAYDLNRNLGGAYREILERLKPEDHCCFLDHDAVFTTRDWYKQILTAIERYPDAGLFGAVTNRIGNRDQVVAGAPAGHDMAAHRLFGKALQDKHGSEGTDITDGHVLSGVVLVIPAAARPGFKIENGFFGVDNEMHRAVKRAGKRVYLLRGLYCQHWYRGDNVGHVNAPKAKRTY